MPSTRTSRCSLPVVTVVADDLHRGAVRVRPRRQPAPLLLARTRRGGEVMLWTILIVLAIIALVVFVLAHAR